MRTRRVRPDPIPRSAFAGFCFPPDVIVLAVCWYLRFGLSYRDVEELLAEHGIEVDHGAAGGCADGGHLGAAGPPGPPPAAWTARRPGQLRARLCDDRPAVAPRPEGAASGQGRVALAVWGCSPIDLVPEFLPVIGPLDDVLVVALALRYAARQVPREVLVAAWPGEPRLLERLLGGPAPATG
jgi:hypothetical protein